MLFEIAVSLLILLIIPLSIWCGYYFYYCHGLALPSVPILPILGTKHVLRDKEEFLPIFQKYSFLYGKTFKGMIGHITTILTRDLNFVKYILSSNKLIRKSHMYKFLHEWLRNGLLTSDGQNWRNKRKLLTPAYHFVRLGDFITTFDQNADILIKQLSTKVDQEIEIFSYMKLCTLDIICEAAMGTKINAQLHGDTTYVSAVNALSHLFIERVYTPIQHIPFINTFTSTYQEYMKNLKIVHNYTSEVVASRKKILNSQNNSSEKSKVFLDILLQQKIDGKPLSDEEIMEEVDTFMFEGHDTVATALSFTLFEIANNNDVQEKLFEEQHLIFGNEKNINSSYRDLQEMKYLEMVIKEALRLYPPIPYIAREVSENFKYQCVSDNFNVKNGVQLMISAFIIHRDPDVYPDPETFNPERFSLENQAKQHPYSYLAFSAGPRNCIGQKFAMLEMKAILSKLIRNYIFCPLIPAHKPHLLAEIILKSKNGILIKMKKR